MQGKSFLEASQAGKEAGYTTRLDIGAGGRKYSALDYMTNSKHDPWTVCWYTTDRVKGSAATNGDFWSVLFYMVEQPSDCKDGKLTPEAKTRYATTY
ncbi:hypothetical protein ABT024_32365 [Streptomyces sp. NPDC002812]|uniref:hypothetical protein n=1 Tax=unclassified Streptomyces TaxID=2593676 RepID=UPI0022546275|nr:hypothetical protein [Streptomyces sp. NBC_00347]MCX5125490.1 hypothetical protein [Streptomyces sp. NBC_00347]